MTKLSRLSAALVPERPSKALPIEVVLAGT